MASVVPDAGRIQQGWAVFGADRRIVGTVSGVRPDCMVVSVGILRRRKLFVPLSAIEATSADRVQLKLPKPAVMSQSWWQPPRQQGRVAGTAGLAGAVPTAGPSAPENLAGMNAVRPAADSHGMSPAIAAQLAPLQPGLLLEIPMMAEEVAVRAEPHVVEEVEVQKQEERHTP
jgi:hypothetical protein